MAKLKSKTAPKKAKNLNKIENRDISIDSKVDYHDNQNL